MWCTKSPHSLTLPKFLNCMLKKVVDSFESWQSWEYICTNVVSDCAFWKWVAFFAFLNFRKPLLSVRMVFNKRQSGRMLYMYNRTLHLTTLKVFNNKSFPIHATRSLYSSLLFSKEKLNNRLHFNKLQVV